MATLFLEPGGDATFTTLPTTGNGFWDTVTSGVNTATDFVHGSHIKSIQYSLGGNFDNAEVRTPIGTLADAGTRISFYIYLNALPAATTQIAFVEKIVAIVVQLKLTSAGVLQIFNTTTQIGTNGATLSTGQWYRICLAYTITSTSVNRFELFVNGVSSISITNATITNTVSSRLSIGNITDDTSLDMRTSDHYIDNSSSLTDTGDIWVTAKRPNANGTTNGFTTQVGSGGSGYGSGHSPQVNERPLSTTDGWSMVGAGSAVTEEYNIESKSQGDIDISSATIVDWLGWASMKSLASETVQMIVDGQTFSQAITSTITLYTKVANQTTYPVGTGSDIGITTATDLTTVSLYECGILVAYIPATPPSITGPFPTHFQV